MEWLMIGSIEGADWAEASDSDEDVEEIDQKKRRRIKKPLSDADAEGIIELFARMKQRRIPMLPDPKA